MVEGIILRLHGKGEGEVTHRYWQREKSHMDTGRMLENGYKGRLDHSFRTNSSDKTSLNRFQELPVVYLLPLGHLLVVLPPLHTVTLRIRGVLVCVCGILI